MNKNYNKFLKVIDKIEKLDRKIIQIGWIFLDLLLDIHLKRQVE